MVHVGIPLRVYCMARSHESAVSVFTESQALKSSKMNMMKVSMCCDCSCFLLAWRITNFVSAIRISPLHRVVLSEKQTRWHGIPYFHKWPLRYDFMGHQFYIPLKIPFRWTGIFLQISVLILFLFQLLLNKLTKKNVCKEIKCRAKSYTINGRFAECLMSKAFG